jgi:1-aminocyclopropane-1-carboxylate deaminase/D-cysteine desulfhydrase-like pyridoxal-dependent ACC family enzyme
LQKGLYDVIQLFKHYPLLKDKLAYISLGEFPTPIQKLDRLGEAIGVGQLYIKRDDLSGKLYGGNKIRKLEFLLGHALHSKAKGVLTFGNAGSNHALATAIYAKRLGLRCVSMLMPQPNASCVRHNLLMSYYYGAELHHYRNIRSLALGTKYHILRHKLRYGQFPQNIPLGGTSLIGTIGYVNAAFELKEQIIEGKMPEPDCIYVASGTMGTSVGLILGIKAVNLKSRVISVLVANDTINLDEMARLFYETNSLLHSADPSFPKCDFCEKDEDIRNDFLGKGYARFTEEGMDAVARMKRNEGIKLDGTYTGKAFAALIHDAENKLLRDRVILFWNTYNSIDFPDIINTLDYRHLPRCLHRYFEEEVQPLDEYS